MKIGFMLFLLLVSVVVNGNKYTETKCSKDENGNEHCEKDVEEEEEEEDACFYEEKKESLVQWDPVKVRQSHQIVVAINAF